NNALELFNQWSKCRKWVTHDHASSSDRNVCTWLERLLPSALLKEIPQDLLDRDSVDKTDRRLTVWAFSGPIKQLHEELPFLVIAASTGGPVRPRIVPIFALMAGTGTVLHIQPEKDGAFPLSVGYDLVDILPDHSFYRDGRVSAASVPNYPFCPEKNGYEEKRLLVEPKSGGGWSARGVLLFAFEDPPPPGEPVLARVSFPVPILDSELKSPSRRVGHSSGPLGGVYDLSFSKPRGSS
ncbi:unnamed protein product, partial [Amoebophrya sp. A25]